MNQNELEVKVAVLEEKASTLDKSVVALQANQRWGIITILGLLASSVFQWISNGGGL